MGSALFRISDVFLPLNKKKWLMHQDHLLFFQTELKKKKSLTFDVGGKCNLQIKELKGMVRK